jgi:hypothetical protein
VKLLGNAADFGVSWGGSGQEQQTQWMNREGTAGGISKSKHENGLEVRCSGERKEKRPAFGNRREKFLVRGPGLVARPALAVSQLVSEIRYRPALTIHRRRR